MFLTENAIWEALIPVIRAGVAELNGIAVKRAYQASPQAGGNEPRIVLHRVSSRRYGSQGTRQEVRQGTIIAVDVWRKEDTFQANAVVDRAPEDDGYTAKDALEILAAHLQSEPALDALRKQGLGVLRVNDIAETPYQDDQGAHRISVSLQFTVTYKQTRERVVPAADAGEFRINRI